MTEDLSPSVKTMNLRYAGTCRECGHALAAGTLARYDSATRTVRCVQCMPTVAAEIAIEAGVAGASAQRRYEHLSEQRETRIRTNHPRIGGILLALSDEPQRITAWQKGARGESLLGAGLDKLAGKGVHVLHDRRIPGTKANIDHVAIGPRGVFVIDAKRYKGAPSLRVTGGIFDRRERLMVGSRDCTKLAGGVQWQVTQVEEALEAAGFDDIPVFGMLCFVEADWPLLSSTFTIDNIEVLWPRKAATRITSPGSFGGTAGISMARSLALHFPPA